MKKLMIAFAAVAMAACAQAATVTWTASGIAQYGKSDAATTSLGYVAVLIDADICAAGDMVDAIKSGTWKSELAAAKISGSDVTVGSPMAGMISKSGAGNYENLTMITAYGMVFDGSIDKAEHVYFTQTMSKTTGAKGQAAAFGFGAQADSATAGNWTTLNVPEPTSGLLLLLGVAGLALKRKRA